MYYYDYNIYKSHITQCCFDIDIVQTFSLHYITIALVSHDGVKVFFLYCDIVSRCLQRKWPRSRDRFLSPLIIITTSKGKIETKVQHHRKIIWEGNMGKWKNENSLLLITSQTGDLTFHFGRFPHSDCCPGLCLRVKTNQRHLYGEDCWPLKGLGQFRPACFVFSPFLFPLTLSSCPVCLRRKVGKFLQATSLQVSVGFKHAHWDFGTVHVSTVVSDSALYGGWHFVTIGEVSFFSQILSFLVYFG